MAASSRIDTLSLPLVIARRAAPVGPHVITDFTGRMLIAELYKVRSFARRL